MNFAYTILYVDDVARSLAFYESAFGFAIKVQHEGGDYGELETGATSLAFASRSLMTELHKNPKPSNPRAPCFEIAFTTDDVPAALDRACLAGAELIQPPEQMPWGQTVAYIADADGVLIEVCTPMAAET